MLARFTIKHTFNKLRVSLHVCNEHREAEMMVMYDRRIIRTGEKVPYHEASTPELAEKWLSRPIGIKGNLVETLEFDCRTGLLQPLPEIEDETEVAP